MSTKRDEEMEYKSAVAPESITLQEDSIVFARASMLPVTIRGTGLPGMAVRNWDRLTWNAFYGHLPEAYSIVIRCEPPVVMQNSLRARRSIYEGALTVLAQKTGRNPSMAERERSAEMDQAESNIGRGKQIYRAFLMAAIYCARGREDDAELLRRQIETNLQTWGLMPQRFYHVADLSLQHLQPGGALYPEKETPYLFQEEALGMLPRPSCSKMPVDDALWIGKHYNAGHDVFFSYKTGLTTQPIPTSLTMILGGVGEGKTCLMRTIMAQRLLMGRTVVSIDPEGENNRLCESLGGTVVPAGIPRDSETCLMHPLSSTLDVDDERYAAGIFENAKFILKLLHGEGPITAAIENIIGMAIQRLWKNKHGPISFGDLLDTIGTMDSPETGLVIPFIQPYAQGGIYAGYFDRPKTLLKPDFEPGKWINFDLSEMADGTNKDIMLVLLAMFLRDAVTIGKNPMDIFFDEGWLLLRTPAFRNLIDELGRRARKRDVGVTMATHLPSDFMEEGTSLNLATTTFIGRMNPKEANPFLLAMGIPPSDAEKFADQITNLEPHVFMAVPAGNTATPFRVRVIIPPTWLQMFDRYKKMPKVTNAA
jgi:hypothetical protein